MAKGLIDGSIISVSCSPVSGGSTDDLTETTTVFECFVATNDNGDGTMSGFKYHATMNWTPANSPTGWGHRSPLRRHGVITSRSNSCIEVACDSGLTVQDEGGHQYKATVRFYRER